MRIPDQIYFGRLMLAGIGGLFCAALTWFGWVESLDHVVYDEFNEILSIPRANDLVIVAVDERSLLELGRWPWRRENHVEMLRQLREQRVAAVAMDILFSEHYDAYPEVDQMLGEVMLELGNLVLPVFIGQPGLGGPLREMLPVEPIGSAAAALGHVHIEIDRDGVARSVYLREGVGQARWPHFTLALAQVLGLDSEALPGVVDQSVLAEPNPRAIIRSHANLIPFMGPAGTVPQIPFVDVMRGRVPAGSLRDKIVLVGATAPGHLDSIVTSHGRISGIEINANIFQALRGGYLMRPVDSSTASVAALLIIGFGLFFYTRLEPDRLLLAVLLALVVLPSVSLAVMHFARLWVSPVPVMLTLLFAYPLWNWLRLAAALDFIHEQLEGLQRENQPLAQSPGWDDLARRADFLTQLGLVSSWEWAPCGQDATEHWQHAGARSGRRFCIGGDSRCLVLNRTPGGSELASKLDQLFPPEPFPELPPVLGADVLNINLQQLEQAYAEAQSNNELVRGALSQLTSAVLLADLSGKVLLLNQQARDLLDLGTGDLELLPILARVETEPDINVHELVAGLVGGGTPFNLECRSAATGRDLLWQGGVIGEERPLLMFVMTDVTALKQSERRRIETLNFLGHDLRAPLTSVLALIHSARDQRGGDDALLDEVEGYVRANLSYAENFIQLARLDYRDEVRFDDCDAHSLVDNAIAQLYHTAAHLQVGLAFDCGEDDIWLLCSRDLVQRALINLIDNGLKYSPAGGEIRITLRHDEPWVVFEVSDQGAGMNPGDLQRIFEAFEQGESSSSGVGLGLRFVHAVAKVHGGSIEAANLPSGGSRFTLQIPIHPSQN